ncbi:MAG: WecB/TagA/CpsF family glycosyltransferase [Patescibacteria group bacterium]
MIAFPILGIRIDKITKPGIHKKLDEFLQSETYDWIATINAEILVHAYNDIPYAEILNISSLNIIDGSGPQYMARILLNEKVKRFPGVDLIEDVVERAYANKKKILFLGGREAVGSKLASEIVAEKFKKMYTDIQILCEQGGEMNYINDKVSIEQGRRERILQFAPDVVLVAASNPEQEKIVHSLSEEFPSLKLGIGIGGGFNMKAGVLKRAPNLFKVLGLEWLWRLILEPKRIKRIFNAVIVFPWLVTFRKFIPRLRPNVVACIVDDKNNILVAERIHDPGHWQFPQGGIEPDHSVEETIYKELEEEVGITKEMIGSYDILPEKHSYTWSQDYMKQHYRSVYQGQKQTVAIVHFKGSHDDIVVDKKEFSKAIWVPKHEVLELLHPVRHSVAKIALKALE